MARPVLFLGALLALAACDAGVESRKEATPEPGRVLPPQAAAITQRDPAVPAGTPRDVPAVTGPNLQEAAAVSQLAALPDQSAKIFSVSGGDPAVNGLVTYLGLFAGPAEGWRVYPIGDFREWRLGQVGPGRLVIEARVEGADASGGIAARDQRLIVEFARGDAPPPSIRVTPAR